MININKEKGYCILYRSIIIVPNLIFFLPCGCGEGYLCADGLFEDNAGEVYMPCNDYYMVSAAENDLYFYHAITKRDLKQQYNDNNISDSLYDYKEKKTRDLLIGNVNHKDKDIDLITISYDLLMSFRNNISYSVENSYGQVTLNKVILHELIKEDNIKKIKKVLKDLITGISNVEALNKSEGPAEVRISSDGKSSITHKNYDAINKTPKKETNVSSSNAAVEDVAIVNNKRQLYQKVWKYVTERMFGQNEAIQDIITIIVNNLSNADRYHLPHMLLVGPSGSGKTLLIRLISECIDIPVTEYDCNSLTQEGYTGKSVSDILKLVYLNSNSDIDKAEHSILVLDEVDKIASRGSTISDIAVQNALLKLLDGTVFDLEVSNSRTIKFDTSHLIILASGAFEGIRNRENVITGFNQTNVIAVDDFVNQQLSLDELIKYGMNRQFISRFPYIIPLTKLNNKEMLNVLKTSLISPLKSKKELFKDIYNIDLKCTDGYYQAIIKNSELSERNGRGLALVVHNSLLKAENYILSHSDNYRNLIVTEETVENPKVFTLK